MTKEEIIKYVSYTPTNTNPNVLRSMLATLESSDGSGSPEPTGTTIINANGTYDVKSYEFAEVDVPTSVGGTLVNLEITNNLGIKIYLPDTPDENGLCPINPIEIANGATVTVKARQNVTPQGTHKLFEFLQIVPPVGTTTFPDYKITSKADGGWVGTRGQWTHKYTLSSSYGDQEILVLALLSASTDLETYKMSLDLNQQEA